MTINLQFPTFSPILFILIYLRTKISWHKEILHNTKGDYIAIIQISVSITHQTKVISIFDFIFIKTVVMKIELGEVVPIKTSIVVFVQSLTIALYIIRHYTHQSIRLFNEPSGLLLTFTFGSVVSCC